MTNQVIQSHGIAFGKDGYNLFFIFEYKALIDKVVNGGGDQELIDISQTGVDLCQLFFYRYLDMMSMGIVQ